MIVAWFWVRRYWYTAQGGEHCQLFIFQALVIILGIVPAICLGICTVLSRTEQSSLSRTLSDVWIFRSIGQHSTNAALCQACGFLVSVFSVSASFIILLLVIHMFDGGVGVAGGLASLVDVSAFVDAFSYPIVSWMEINGVNVSFIIYTLLRFLLCTNGRF